MKKLIIILLLIGLTGCNPIGSAIDKEGEETRLQMQTELAAAKVEITEEMRQLLDALFVNVSGQIVSVMQFMQVGGVIR